MLKVQKVELLHVFDQGNRGNGVWQISSRGIPNIVDEPSLQANKG